MRLKSSPRCESLRLPQQRQVWTREAAGQVTLGCLLSPFHERPKRVPDSVLGTTWPPEKRPKRSSPMNWIPGDMNPVKNEARSPISEEELYELSNTLL